MRVQYFLNHLDRFVSTAISRHIAVLMNPNTIVVLQVVRETEKAFLVRLFSKPSVYLGHEYFWVPKAALAPAKEFESIIITEEALDFNGIQILRNWYKLQMDNQDMKNWDYFEAKQNYETNIL